MEDYETIFNSIFNSNSDMLTVYESTMRLISYVETEIEKLNEEKIYLMARCSVLNYGIDLIKYSVFKEYEMNPDQSCKDMIINKLNQLKKLKLEVEELKRKNNELEKEMRDIKELLVQGDCDETQNTGNDIQVQGNVNFGKLLK